MGRTRYMVLVSYGTQSIAYFTSGTSRERAFAVAENTKSRMKAMDRHLGLGQGFISVITTKHRPVWIWSLEDGETLNGMVISTALELLDLVTISGRVVPISRYERKAIRFMRTLVIGKERANRG